MNVKRVLESINFPKIVFWRRNLHKISTISEVFKSKNEGFPATVQGWVKALRVQKKNVFLDLNDGSCNENIQIYLPASDKPDNLTWGSSIEVTGIIATTPKGQLELLTDNLKVLGPCIVTDGFPFHPRKTYPSDYIRQYMHLRPRTNYIASMLRVRDAATRAFHNHLGELGYIGINAPILTSNDCEGAGEVFRVEPESDSTVKAMAKMESTRQDAYFGVKTLLSVSGQLHLEAAAHGLSKVYTFGPTFRAENSKSRLHLSEFYMLEAELAFTENLNDIKCLIENLIKNVTMSVLNVCDADIQNLRGKDCPMIDWLNKPFVNITYEDAFNLIEQNCDKYETPLKKDNGFAKEHELVLVALMGGVPTFVVDWPKSIKPFYMRDCPTDPTKVAALDLITPITGEIAGGSLRENDYQRLKDKLPSPALNWYLDLRKFGGVPTGGFGLGFERYLQLICGIPNIKDTIPFPRWPHNCAM